MTDSTPIKKRRGRPAVYLDDADRQAAWRERREKNEALGAGARALVERPTLRFVEIVIDRLIEQADDPTTVRAALVAKLAASPCPDS